MLAGLGWGGVGWGGVGWGGLLHESWEVVFSLPRSTTRLGWAGSRLFGHCNDHSSWAFPAALNWS